jgi:hypothetical protein
LKIGARRVGCLLAALAAAGAVVGVAAANRDELIFRHDLWSLLTADPGKWRETAAALFDRDASGQRAVEAVAFDPDAAPLALRQAALDVLIEREPRNAGQGPGDPELTLSPRRLVRYLRDAQGLARTQALDSFPRDATNGDLIDAAMDAVNDPDESVSTRAWAFVMRADVARTLPARRRAAFTCPHPRVRLQAVQLLAGAVDEHVLLRRILADPDEDVRLEAARWLSEKFHDAAGLPVLAAAREPRSPGDARDPALRALVLLDDRSSVAALVAAIRVFPALDVLYAMLERLTGKEPGSITDWQAWFEAHDGELTAGFAPK